MISEVDAEALEDTCEWIQNRAAFLDWQNTPKSPILFLEGGAGIGKSVLATSIVVNLVKNKSALVFPKVAVTEATKECDKAKQDIDKADQEGKGKNTAGSNKKRKEGGLVLSFFSTRSGHRNSPLSVLRHLMNKLLQLDPRALKVSARKHLGGSSTTSDLQSS